MKTAFLRRVTTLLLLFTSLTPVARSQTTLNPGDIMFTSLNADGVPTTSYDGFSFVLLKAVSAGTNISFTDVGWDPGIVNWGGITGVSEMYYTWTSATALPCGTEISISAQGGVSASTGSISGVTGGPNLNITSAGESILAYQGSYASPSFISGIMNYILGWGWNPGAPVTSCGLPAALTNGVNALFPGTTDNWKYNCPVTLGSPAVLRAALANASNWVTDDLIAYPTPPGCIVSCAGTLPVNWLQVKGELNSQYYPVIYFRVEENNVDRYIIEKSTGNDTYQPIATLKSAGNNTNSYTYTEPAALQRTSFYRIKQVDANGVYTYSSVIQLSGQVRTSISLYPNPVTAKLLIATTPDLLNSIASLTDINGRWIQNILIKQSYTEVELSDLPAGLYLVRFATGKTEKFMKQ
jgi:Secretion system C-terminal sorting domain